MTTQGKLGITVKITTLPQVRELDKGVIFDVVCDNINVNIFLQNKRWKKILEAHEKYPMWVATISGVMDNPNKQGFMLNQAIVKIVEVIEN